MRRLLHILLLIACGAASATATGMLQQPSAPDSIALSIQSDTAALPPPCTGTLHICSTDSIALTALTDSLQIPSCANLHADTLIMNGADWSSLFAALRRLESDSAQVVPIVHLGDSHVQAGFFTAALRAPLQERWGNAGRGLIIPLRLCRTNEPTDYKISSASGWQYYKCVGRKHARGETGVGGIAIVPSSRHFSLQVATLSRTGNCMPFSSLRVFHSTGAPADLLQPADSLPGMQVTHPSAGETCFQWADSAAVCSLRLSGRRRGNPDSCAIYGMSLANGNPGILVHGIGNNGACCESYNRIAGYGNKVAALSPRLIIITLGTNESMGRITRDTMLASLDRLVTSLQAACPDAVLLLTTPGENKLRRRRKRNGRWRTYYTTNRNLPVVRNAIMEYAAAHHIAVWDWYAIAGGEGSCEKWIADKKMARDHIHYTRPGYAIQGHLLYQSIARAYERNME